ncbi:hypothetical protein HanPSC8_Chr03g0130551 [Helianthus annuus]|nr:hypothetical protein HanPSC8_Chr03g0130551 [Helianthus annuus]
MFLREINTEFVKNFSSITTQRPKQGPVPIHNYETEFIIRFQQFIQSFGVKLVITEI